MSDEQQPEMITLHFARGLVGKPFTLNGIKLVTVKIPSGSGKIWDRFVTDPAKIRDNRFGKGVWMQIPAEGKTKICITTEQEPDEYGNRRYERRYKKIPNRELKARVEAYRTKNNDEEEK